MQAHYPRIAETLASFKEEDVTQIIQTAIDSLFHMKPEYETAEDIRACLIGEAGKRIGLEAQSLLRLSDFGTAFMEMFHDRFQGRSDQLYEDRKRVELGILGAMRQ